MIKYDAFISYRHTPVDIEISEALHKRLENFRIPRAVQKKTGIKKINRIFRDREELPVSSNLSENIQKALDASEYLIVICSPRTPASEWVRKEIDYFSRKKGHDRVLALLVEGEPEESFPDELRFREEKTIDINGNEIVFTQEVEPLAADIRAPHMRAQKKALKTEIMRIAAPLLNCTFDDLRQRQRARRNRRIFAGILCVTLAVTVFGVYNYIQTERIRQNYIRQQMTQSMYLADTALRLLESGDRTKAIQVALEALPADLENPERPIVPRAEYALSRAVHAYHNDRDILPMYSVELDDLHGGIAQSSMHGEIFAVIDQRGALYIFEGESGVRTAKITPSREDNSNARFTDVHILSDLRVLALTSDQIFCIDGHTGQILWERYWTDNTSVSPPLMAAYTVSQNEQTIVVSVNRSQNQGRMQTVLLMSLEEGNISWQIDIENDALFVSSLALSPDDGYIAVGMSDYFQTENHAKIYVFETRQGQLISEIELDHPIVRTVIIPDNRTILSMEYTSSSRADDFQAHGELARINLLSGEKEWAFAFRSTDKYENYFFSEMFWAQSEYQEEYVVFVYEKQLHVLSFTTGLVTQSFPFASNIVGIFTDISSGVSLIATERGSSYVMDIYTGYEFRDMSFDIDATITQIQAHYNVFVYLPYNTSTILLYGTADDAEYESLYDLDEYEYLTAMHVSSGQQYIAVKLESMESSQFLESTDILILEAETLRIVDRIQIDGRVKDIAFARKTILIIDQDATIYAYDMSSKDIRRVDTKMQLFYPSHEVSSDQTYVAIYDANTLYVMETDSQEIIYTLYADDLAQQPDAQDIIFNAGLSYDGQYVWVWTNNDVYIFNTHTGEAIELDIEIDALLHSKKMICSAHGYLAAVPTSNYTLAFIDLSSGKVQHEIDVLVEADLSGYFSEENDIFIFQASDYLIRAIDTRTGQMLFTSERMHQPIMSWQYCSARKTVAAINAEEGILYVIDETINMVAIVPQMKGLCPSGEWVLVGDSEQFGRYPYYDLADLIEKAHDILGGAALSEENRLKYYIDA